MKKKNIKELIRRLFDKNGMSMVSVIVAFAILMIMVAMFSQVAVLSQNFIREANETREETAELMEKYYLDDGSIDTSALCEGQDIEVTDGRGAAFTFKTSVYAHEYNGAELYSFGGNESTGYSGGEPGD